MPPIDIAALRETRLAGGLKESENIFLWRGKEEEDVREQGLDFAVRNTLLDKVQLGSAAKDSLLTFETDYKIRPWCRQEPRGLERIHKTD